MFGATLTFQRRQLMKRLMAVLLLVLPVSLTAQEKGKGMGMGKSMAAGPKSAAAKIQEAMGAAPASISKDAAVMDWPAKEGGQMTQLRAGTNGWTCMPDFPQTEGNDPMCVDDQWMGFMGAML